MFGTTAQRPPLLVHLQSDTSCWAAGGEKSEGLQDGKDNGTAGKRVASQCAGCRLDA